MSGTAAPLDPFLKAYAAMEGHELDVETLPFDTLKQYLLTTPPKREKEVFLLFPWDFSGACDWRTGIHENPSKFEDVLEDTKTLNHALMKRKGAKILYVPAAVPPLFTDYSENRSLANYLVMLCAALGAEILEPEVFSLSSYLESGCPVGGQQADRVAKAIMDSLLPSSSVPCKKVLVTDLDNTLWSGGVDEDGFDQIAFEPEGKGFRHFIYQSLLKRFKNEGVLLAAVSWNNEAMAYLPLRSSRMLLQEGDFVSVVAGYEAKSSQILLLAQNLNLGLDSFVFVDDDPLQIAEVRAQLPSVTVFQFPNSEDQLPSFLNDLARLFARDQVTEEDKERTELYRRRLAGRAPSTLQGADLRDFLQQQQMILTICDRSQGDRLRADQLIHKVHQFNLNGKRLTTGEIKSLVAGKGHLFTASLDDKSGKHGEILACLISPEGVVESLVLSCRVFQRRVEYAFLLWLLDHGIAPRGFRYKKTDRNDPARRFIETWGICPESEGIVSFDAQEFSNRFAADRQLFAFMEAGGIKSAAR